MSSDSEHDGDPIGVPTKKRRVQRACDWCRRKKRACDGLRMAENKCTNCIENGLECTFAGAETKRRSYVDVLEARLELTESLLRKLAPQSAGSTLPPPSWSVDSPITSHRSTAIPGPAPPGPGVELAALTIRSMNVPAPGFAAPFSASNPRSSSSPGSNVNSGTTPSSGTGVPGLDDDDSDDDLAHIALAADMQDLSISAHHERFHGKSSGAMLVKAAVLAREGYEQKDLPWTSRRMKYWTYNPAKDRPPPPEPSSEPIKFTFPPSPLLTTLVNLYFIHQNIYFPLLHRPTFERLIKEGKHEEDEGLGAVVLLVCAIGARFHHSSPDSQQDKDTAEKDKNNEPLRTGWEYFDQLPLVIDHLFVRPTLYHLQFYCLATTFLEHSTPSSCWTLIGIGIRLAQDVGAHRLQNFGPNTKPTPEGELWKRAFWVLVCMDRQVSTTLGRPCTTQYEDFDAELPIEVDDEYWEGPNAFTQPPGKPSTITFFNCLIRLDNILGFSLQLLYGLNKAKALLAHRDDAWEEHIVAELDSALNGWVDSIPAHLRWDPNRFRRPASVTTAPPAPSSASAPQTPEDIFFDQSALLYSSYYAVQMTIHRPFIPTIQNAGKSREKEGEQGKDAEKNKDTDGGVADEVTENGDKTDNGKGKGKEKEARKGKGKEGGKAPTTLPSLAICTNAARSASHIIETSRLRKNGIPVPVLLTPAFVAGLVLLLNVWSGKRTGLPPHMNSAIFEVHKCMATIRVCEERWQSAGLCWDLLYELASVGNLPLPRGLPPLASPATPGSAGGNHANAGRRGDDSLSASAFAPALPTTRTAPTSLPQSSAELGASSLVGGPQTATTATLHAGGAFGTLPGVNVQQQQRLGSGMHTDASQTPLADGDMYPVNSAPRPQSHLQAQQQPAPHQQYQQHHSQAQAQTRARMPMLPTYTADLGRLPVFHQHQYARMMQQQQQQAQQPYATQTPGVAPLPNIHNIHNPSVDTGVGAGSGISGSSWYPSQSSTAPFGYPDFTAGAGVAGTGVNMGGSDSFGADMANLFGPEVLPYAPGTVPATNSNATASDSYGLGINMGGVGGGGMPSMGGMMNTTMSAGMMGANLGYGTGVGAGENMLTDDEMAMWANAPMGFEIDDWGSYFSVMSELHQGPYTSSSHS